MVFGHMQEGISKVYDPAGFPALLRMDTGSQQDPQVLVVGSKARTPISTSLSQHIVCICHMGA